ncbi:MAG: YcgN family cysteine cluster protein [Methyloligellaceae bacterium]
MNDGTVNRIQGRKPDDPCETRVTQPFWKHKRLDEMTPDEWESLCDGCGQCCLHKIEDDENSEIALTNVACKYLDLDACRCTDYANRQRNVKDCLQLTPELVPKLRWLPSSCAYRLIAEGNDLMWWHPLVSGDPETVHTAGISVRGCVVSENSVGDLEDHIQSWLNLGAAPFNTKQDRGSDG